MYTEVFVEYPSAIKYYKFLYQTGDVISCHKVIDDKDIIISIQEFEKTKYKTERELIKFILYEFFNYTNLMISIKNSEIITLVNTNSEITAPNLIKYYEFDGIIEKELKTFALADVDYFISYLFNNKLQNTFIEHCVKEFISNE